MSEGDVTTPDAARHRGGLWAGMMLVLLAVQVWRRLRSISKKKLIVSTAERGHDLVSSFSISEDIRKAQNIETNVKILLLFLQYNVVVQERQSSHFDTIQHHGLNSIFWVPFLRSSPESVQEGFSCNTDK